MATATKKTPGPAEKKRKIPVVGIIFGVVAVILILALVFGTQQIGAEFGDPTVEGQLPLMGGETFDQTATGFNTPSVTGQDFDGSTVTIDPTDGRAKAIVFLAHWCPHCRAEVPRVQQWLDATGGVEGVDVYSVATSMNSAQPNFPPSEWLEGEGWTPPVIRDDSDSTVYIAHGAGGFPYWVFVNPDGTVALRTSGEMNIADLEAIMLGLVAQ